MKRWLIVVALVTWFASVGGYAQNYDESKVGNYPLPDPLTFESGKKVRNKRQWAERREEILEIFQREMYGRMPEKPSHLRIEMLEQGPTLGGYATRRQVRMWFNAQKRGRAVDWLIVTPNHIKGPAPTILLLNYQGNQAFLTDDQIAVNFNWMKDNSTNFVQNNRIDERSRGMYLNPNLRSNVPIQMLVARGYAVVTACYADISPDPDFIHKAADGTPLQDEFAYTGVFELWGERDEQRTDNTAALAAWGWVLQRGMDLIERDERLDAKRVLLTGSSRLAKAAMLAAAFDERFPVVVLNQTGGGGVPLQKHYYGENVATMTRQFKHWYCKAFAKYAGKEESMPFDQHMLLACIAPRALLVQGFNEKWFDTKGEFLALRAASDVWEFLGSKGLPKVEWPADYDKSAIGPTLGYYRRDNLHGISAIDWQWMLDFADNIFQEK